jgi:hypothetical protein
MICRMFSDIFSVYFGAGDMTEFYSEVEAIDQELTVQYNFIRYGHPGATHS